MFSKKEGKKAKDEGKGKEGQKAKSSVGLVLGMIGNVVANEALELCRTWGKARDRHALIFLDLRARADFITPELASKLGIKLEEMGGMNEASLAIGYSVLVTPIFGKLRIHIGEYIDLEDFLKSFDVLLGMSWFHRPQNSCHFGCLREEDSFD